MREVKPTQKPVPSSDIKDLFFNSGLLDIWATSLERKYIDRFGNCHLTAAGMEWLFKELVEKFKVDMNIAIVAAGYITIDSFQQGADLPNNEITLRNHILRDETTGEYYRWDGDLPKQVPAGSTPQSTGGIGKGAWVSVGDASLRGDLISDGGANYINGGKAWVVTNENITTQIIEIGSNVTGGNYTWKNERLYKIIGYDGIVSSIEGRVITLDGGKKSYLVDSAFHEGNIEAWGVSSANSYILNYELFQACIFHASGVSVDGIETTASGLFNVKPRHCIYAFIDFKTKPVKILHTTKIYGLRGISGQLLNDGIEFVIDDTSKGCFEFDPKNYCSDHTNQHYYGGVVNYLSASVSGVESIFSFAYADHSCAMEVAGNRAYGMEFFWMHNDGWAASIKNNASNTSCGAFHITRVTTGLAENNYCNYGGSGTDKIGFDYVLSGQIDASSRDLFTKSQHKYSRAVHSVSSNMDFITNTFEHWDIVRAMFSGSVGISSDYIEDIKVCIYAATRVSCTFKPLTIFLGSQENCVILQNNNISGAGRDDITVDLSNLTANTSRIYGIGTPIYTGSNTRVILNAPFISSSNISNIGKYDGVKTVIQCDDELNIYCSSSGIEGSAGLNQLRPVKTVMEALNTAEIVSSSKVNIVILDDASFTSSDLAQIHYSKRNGITIRSTGKNINWGNDLTNIPAIETEEITFDSVNITVPSTSVNRSKRNILRPIEDAKYTFKSCNLDLAAAFLIGDYTGTAKRVFMSLTNTNQTNSTGGTIRNIPAANEKILLTYIRNGGSIAGSDDGTNIIHQGTAIM